jgi:hypothetical protein
MKEKNAWAKKTIARTIPRARFATAGFGSPSGFHATNTRMDARNRIGPNPPKR